MKSTQFTKMQEKLDNGQLLHIEHNIVGKLYLDLVFSMSFLR